MKSKDFYFFIDVNKNVHPTGTLTTTFLRPTGKANTRVQFIYTPQKVFNHNRVQVSASMQADLTNNNKQVNNQQHLDLSENSKVQYFDKQRRKKST